MKYVKEFIEVFSKKDFFSTKDVKLFLLNKGANKSYFSVFLSNLIKQKKIFRISHGFYSFKERIDSIEKNFFPSYHGLQDALTIHELWGQQTNTILITPKKIRSGERIVNGNKVFIKKINRKMFFGFESIKIIDSWVMVSDIEKTLIDFVYYNENIDKKTLENLKRKIDLKKLKKYLKNIDKRYSKKVLFLIQ
jgi:predicted transcriptional regulator of viral defense system